MAGCDKWKRPNFLVTRVEQTWNLLRKQVPNATILPNGDKYEVQNRRSWCHEGRWGSPKQPQEGQTKSRGGNLQCISRISSSSM